MRASSWRSSTSRRVGESEGSAPSRRTRSSPSSPRSNATGSRGKLFVISGPSGVGKGTVVKRLIARDPELWFSVSATTRAARPGETGRDYLFLSDAEFDAMVARQAFLEWAEVFGRRYGTPSEPVEQARGAGRSVVLEIDVQGARAVRSRVPDAVLVFLVPPSREELARRLRERGTEDDDKLRRRLSKADAELGERVWFDHVVVNDDLDRAADDVAAIIAGAPDDR